MPWRSLTQFLAVGAARAAGRAARSQDASSMPPTLLTRPVLSLAAAEAVLEAAADEARRNG